jgi:drug/metabolite transporter superfamily protein YnfA
MALVKCKECNGSVSTEAAACPHCGAPQQRPVPPPLPVQPKEETIYSDNIVVVTNMRIMIGGATYALRNVTSVKKMFTPPQLAGPILVLLGGIFLLLLTIIPFNPTNYQPLAGGAFGGSIIIGSLIWMCCIKTKYHVDLSTSAGEIHLLTSKNKAYIEKIVASINDAIVKYK